MYSLEFKVKCLNEDSRGNWPKDGCEYKPNRDFLIVVNFRCLKIHGPFLFVEVFSKNIRLMRKDLTFQTKILFLE